MLEEVLMSDSTVLMVEMAAYGAIVLGACVMLLWLWRQWRNR